MAVKYLEPLVFTGQPSVGWTLNGLPITGQALIWDGKKGADVYRCLLLGETVYFVMIHNLGLDFDCYDGPYDELQLMIWRQRFEGVTSEGNADAQAHAAE